MQKYSNLKTKQYKLKLRLANSDDLVFCLKLHNENVKKRKFFSKNKVSLQEHRLWFKKKLKDKMLYICTLKSKIGYIRYEILKKNCLAVSIALKDKYKRKGFGKIMLEKTLRKKKIKMHTIFAIIQKNNISSKKFFLSNGFENQKKNTYIKKIKNI